MLFRGITIVPFERCEMSERVYLRKNGKWEARYIVGKTKSGHTKYRSVFGDTKEEAIARRDEVLGRVLDDEYSPSKLNVLILGAGSFGREVKEVLEKIRLFNRIDFLDDFATGEDIRGKCEDAKAYKQGYPCAFVAIGDNEIRKKYAHMLLKEGFYIPTIISPDAIVSSKAKIGMGTMIFASANVGAAEVGHFCLVQANGLVSADASVGNFSRIDNSAVVLKGEHTPEGLWLKTGKIYGEE